MDENDISEVLLLPDIRTIKPGKLNAPNSVLANRFFDEQYADELFNKTEWILNPKAKEKYQMTVTDILVYYYDTKTKEKQPITLDFFDYAVFSAICTIAQTQYANGQKRFIMSAKMILETISGVKAHNGKQRKSRVLQDISDSVQKMRSVFVEFNWKKQAEVMNKANKFKDGAITNPDACYTENENMLNIKVGKKRINGQVVDETYELLTIPSLYKYSLKISQILSLDKSILSIPKLTNNVNTISLKLCMAKRVELLKNSKNHISNPVIKYDYVCSQCGFDSEDRLERQQRKEQMVKACNYWRDMGYINDYSIKQEKGKFTGIEIVT